MAPKQIYLIPLIYFLCILTDIQGQGSLLWPPLSPEKNSGEEVVPAPVAENKKPAKPEVSFSLPGGYYREAISLELTCPGAVIYFSTDGSRPSKSSKLYTGPINISKTSVVRVLAYKNSRKGKYLGQTYFINEPSSTIPTVSIGIDPDVLFDPENGLYMKGPNAIDSLWKQEGANFWSRREVKAHVDLYETKGDQVFSSQVGLRLFGGISRLFPQKSLTIVARDRYGKKRIKHNVFGKGNPKKHKFLVLRNSGSDWGKSHLRDALMGSLLDDWDIEKQAYRPAHVYLNGNYWGIYNIREKINRYFIEDHYDVDKDSIDLLEHRMSLKRGSVTHYKKMLHFLSGHSLEKDRNYQFLNTMMDIDNFMQYQIAQIFFDNKDAGGNIKFWRPQQKEGRWRWILYDTDWGFGLHDAHAYRSNTLKFHTNPEGPSWPNPPWSTFILRKLLENDQFRNDFVNRMMDHLNTTFKEERVLEAISKKQGALRPEIKRHFDRWRLSENQWERHLNIMKRFAEKRPQYIIEHLKEFFSLGNLESVHISSIAGGLVQLNDYVRIEDKQEFFGSYFCDHPIKLTASPDYGYRFSHWEGIQGQAARNPSIQIRLIEGKPLELKAVFEPFHHPLDGQVFINEICVKNKRSGDWIEIHNHSSNSVCLDKWFLRDRKNEYIIPSGCIDAKGYVILAQDSMAFRSVHGNSARIIGKLPFGLNKNKESLALYAPDRSSIDTIYYEFEDKEKPFTWALLNPKLDNQFDSNWEFVPGDGTPGLNNPTYMLAKIRQQQQKWLKIGSTLGLLLVGLALYLANRRRNRLIRRVL